MQQHRVPDLGFHGGLNLSPSKARKRGAQLLLLGFLPLAPCHCDQQHATLHECGESSAVPCGIRVSYLLFKGRLHAFNLPELLCWEDSLELLSLETPTAAARSWGHPARSIPRQLD